MKSDRRDLVAQMLKEETGTCGMPPSQRAGYAAAARWLG
jgi:hypothetical protein